MAFTHNFIRGWNNGGNSLSKSIAAVGGAELNIDEAIPASTTDGPVEFVLDVSQLKGLFMVSDRAITVKTNSSGSPVNTFTLAANTPYMWVTGDPAIRDTAGAAFTTDVTVLYVTNSDPSNAAQFQLRCLTDPTV